MVLSHRHLIGVSVFIAALGVGLIVAAFATDHWIDSNPAVNETLQKNGTGLLSGGSDSKYTANITFGLFTGYRSIDYSFGVRRGNLKIDCDTSEQACAYVDADFPLSTLIAQYKNQTEGSHQDKEMFGLFSFPVYATTLVLLVLAIIWGFLAIGFGVFNVFGRPIETITGPSGLYVWNILAFVFTVAAIGTYLGLYFSQLRVNILTQMALNAGFTSEDLTKLDFSFYFVVAAAFVFIINLIVLSISGQKCSCSYSRSGEKEVDNGMILY